MAPSPGTSAEIKPEIIPSFKAFRQTALNFFPTLFKVFPVPKPLLFVLKSMILFFYIALLKRNVYKFYLFIFKSKFFT